jgi:RNA methyltransferase, TrmH family
MERIRSRQNAIVKRFRDLARTPRGGAATGPGGAAEVLLDGEHLLAEALASGVPVEVAAFGEKALATTPAAARIASDVQERGGRVLSVADSVLSAMSPVQQPSGVVAIARARQAGIGAVLAAASGSAVALALAGVQDPGNVGGIIRTAAAFGAAGVAAVDGSANPFGWKALRGAMGGTFRLPIAAGGTMADVIAAAKEHRIRILGAVPHGGTPLARLAFDRPTVVLLGAEGSGLPSSVLDEAYETLSISTHGVESLNVAIAAAIVLYEAARQRTR